MKLAGVTPKDVSYYEINEAFSAVAIANNIKLELDPEKVNVNGGAVALGHPTRFFWFPNNGYPDQCSQTK
jgi:acetyl-CoA C-acetyltransferase